MSRVNVADILQKRCQYESHLPHNARKPRNPRKADKSKGFGVFDFKMFFKFLEENTAFCVHSVHESVHDCTRLLAFQADNITDFVIRPRKRPDPFHELRPFSAITRTAKGMTAII